MDLTGWESRWNLNQSQRVHESWQTGCELGETKLEQKTMHMEGLGKLTVRNKLTWKVSRDLLHEGTRAYTRMPAQTHTCISLPVTLSCLTVTLMNWTVLCGEAVSSKMHVFTAAFGDIAQDPFQACPHPSSRSGIHLCHFLRKIMPTWIWTGSQEETKKTYCKDYLWCLMMFPLPFFL